MDPTNANVLIAGMWDFRRKGWTFRSGGDGPTAVSGSALFRSSDGGTTWHRMSAATNRGLPKGPWGRIEVEIAPSNAKTVYAFIEKSAFGTLTRLPTAVARGKNATAANAWFGARSISAAIAVDPTNDRRLFKMNLRMIVSDDGGKSFADSAGGSHGELARHLDRPDGFKNDLRRRRRRPLDQATMAARNGGKVGIFRSVSSIT